MAGKRYKHPDTLKDQRPQRLATPPLDIVPSRTLDEIPPPPRGLLTRTREYWLEAWTSEPGRLIRMVDRGVLDRYIVSLDQWARASADAGELRRLLLAKPKPGPCSCEAGADGQDHAKTCAARPRPWDKGSAIANFYFTAKPIHSRIARLDAVCHAYEQAFGLNPLARMRLNIQALDAMSSLEEFQRSFMDPDGGDDDGGDAAAGYVIDPDE